MEDMTLFQPSVEIRRGEKVTYEDVHHICSRLRATDEHEFSSVGYLPEYGWILVNNCAVTGGEAFVAFLRGEPVFAFGTNGSFPHVRWLWGFGTDKATRVMPEVTRFVKEEWLPRMMHSGVRRIEVRLPRSCTQSIEWLKSFGMYIESDDVRHLSLTGEPFVQLAYTRDQFYRVS